MGCYHIAGAIVTLKDGERLTKKEEKALATFINHLRKESDKKAAKQKLIVKKSSSHR